MPREESSPEGPERGVEDNGVGEGEVENVVVENVVMTEGAFGNVVMGEIVRDVLRLVVAGFNGEIIEVDKLEVTTDVVNKELEIFVELLLLEMLAEDVELIEINQSSFKNKIKQTYMRGEVVEAVALRLPTRAGV